MQDSALDLTLSVSVTTRTRRSSEVDGVHYHFIDRDEFERMKAGGRIAGIGRGARQRLWHAATPVEKVLAEGRDMLFDIDWQGAKQVRERLGDDVVSIFILPPSMRELRARLERRAEDTALRSKRVPERKARDRALAQVWPPQCLAQRVLLAPALDLLLRVLESRFDRGSGVLRPPLEARAQFPHRGRQDENADDIVAQPFTHLLCALPVDVEQHVAPFGEHLFHRLQRRAIAVAVHLGRFEQFARRPHPLEFAPGR